MGTAVGPNIVEDGLVFCIDASGRKGTSPLGNSLFNGASSLVNNLVGSKENVSALNGTHIGGLDFYTIFAIDYPENSFGGDAAGREGITPGLNVRSGTKTFDYGRALHYSIYDNVTQTFVKHTRYDSYVGTAAADTFVSEYSSSINTYTDATHIVAGSHRDGYHTTAQYEILRDLGAPSNVDSIIGFSSPEWILVGKPGLGAGNAYGWVFQNYTTDSTKVAHLNVGLPIYKNTENYFAFDGTDDNLDADLQLNYGNFSVEMIARWNSLSDLFCAGSGTAGAGLTGGTNFNAHMTSSGFYVRSYAPVGGPAGWNTSSTVSSTSSTNTTYHITVVNIDTVWYFYKNGTLVGSVDALYTPNSASTRVGIFRNHVQSAGNAGKVYAFKIYNKELTAGEIKQNYNAYKNRFDI